LDDLFNFGIKNHTFPGAVVAVVNATDLLYMKAYGSFMYPDSRQDSYITSDVIYDMASVTKVVTITSVIMHL